VSAPLTNEQIDELRKTVAAGKRRRVVLLADSAGLRAGKAGDVTRVGQPEVDGEDFIGVRIGGDELFFSPSELGTGGGRRSAKATSAAPPPAPASPPARARAPRAAGPRPAKASAVKASPVPASNPATAKPTRGKGKTPAVAVTIRSTDSGWTVEAQRGGRVALKATAVRAGAVQALADQLGEPALVALVREVIDVRRAVVASQADELRHALAQAEAALAEYD
jgi:hypothetical protein